MREHGAHAGRIHALRGRHERRRLARSCVDLRRRRRSGGRLDERGGLRGWLDVPALRRRGVLRAEHVCDRDRDLRCVLRRERSVSGRLGLLQRARLQREGHVRRVVPREGSGLLGRELLPRDQVLPPHGPRLHRVWSSRDELHQQQRVLLEQLREQRLRRQRGLGPRRRLSRRDRVEIPAAPISGRGRTAPTARPSAPCCRSSRPDSRR